MPEDLVPSSGAPVISTYTFASGHRGGFERVRGGRCQQQVNARLDLRSVPRSSPTGSRPGGRPWTGDPPNPQYTLCQPCHLRCPLCPAFSQIARPRDGLAMGRRPSASVPPPKRAETPRHPIPTPRTRGFSRGPRPTLRSALRQQGGPQGRETYEPRVCPSTPG